MRVGNQIPLSNSNDKMPEVLLEMTSKHLGCTAIINESGSLIGIITDGDLRRHITQNFLTSTASEIMTKNPITIEEDMLAVEAINLMNKKSITNLFVLNDSGKVKGILHLHDCLRAGVV